MIALILYLFFIFLELIILSAAAIYVISLIYSFIYGSLYVGTRQKEIDAILAEIHFKKGQKLLDIGCGDGRVLITAAKKYGVKGVGIDINPVLVLTAKIKAKLSKVKDVTFKRGNIVYADNSGYDVIYIFLMPKLIAKLTKALQREAKKSLIISHGFEIHDWKKYLVKTIPHKPFPTYFYKLK